MGKGKEQNMERKIRKDIRRRKKPKGKRGNTRRGMERGE